jgi:retron-type reverse transcriptase
VTAASYAEHLEANRTDLYERLHGGRYTASPVKRVWLDKEDGSQRPIGMPAFEDNIVQRAVTMLVGRSMSRTFMTAPTAFGKATARTRHCTSCGSSAWS